MKRKILFPSNEFSDFQIQYIKLWREKKHYLNTPYLDVGDIIELLFATTHTLEVDGSDGRFFNYCLHNEESLIAWDGDDPLDIWVYQVKQNINHILSSGRTFHDVIDKEQ